MIKPESGNWQSRKDRLIAAYYELENNLLWQMMQEDCYMRAADLDQLAGAAASDRDMNRMHGMAGGIRSLINRHKEISDMRMSHYETEQIKEESENAPENDGAQGAGRKADNITDIKPGPVKRRSFFADTPDKEPES